MTAVGFVGVVFSGGGVWVAVLVGGLLGSAGVDFVGDFAVVLGGFTSLGSMVLAGVVGLVTLDVVGFVGWGVLDVSGAEVPSFGTPGSVSIWISFSDSIFFCNALMASSTFLLRIIASGSSCPFFSTILLYCSINPKTFFSSATKGDSFLRADLVLSGAAFFDAFFSADFSASGADLSFSVDLALPMDLSSAAFLVTVLLLPFVALAA